MNMLFFLFIWQTKSEDSVSYDDFLIYHPLNDTLELGRSGEIKYNDCASTVHPLYSTLVSYQD